MQLTSTKIESVIRGSMVLTAAVVRDDVISVDALVTSLWTTDLTG